MPVVPLSSSSALPAILQLCGTSDLLVTSDTPPSIVAHFFSIARLSCSAWCDPSRPICYYSTSDATIAAMGSVNRQQIPDLDLAAAGQTLSRRERVSLAPAAGGPDGRPHLRGDRAHHFLSPEPVLGQRPESARCRRR